MFTLVFIRGTILGISIGLMSRLLVKKVCKKNKTKDNNVKRS